MVQCLRKSVLGVLLASTVLVQGVSPARAGDLNSSEALMIVSVLRIQISPTGPRPASCGNRRWLAASGFSTTR